jgi:salicylate synthetase
MSARVLIELARRLAPTEDYFLWQDETRVELAFGQALRLTVRGRDLEVRGADGGERARAPTEAPFSDLGAHLATHGARAFGYFGFELAGFRYAYRKKSGCPAATLLVPRVIVRASGDRIDVVEAPAGERQEHERAIAEAAIEGARRAAEPPPGRRPSLDLVNAGRETYVADVARVKSAIASGRVEKVILARRVSIPGRLDALATFAQDTSRWLASSARSFAFRLGEVTGVGFCPAVLLGASADGTVVTNPLAGTRPRGKSPADDERLVRELLRDPKELAEHAMSARLAYDEIAAVCTPERTRVVDFMRVKSYPFTHHLSSRVLGDLAGAASAWDALAAVFPGVTCSGIPKADAVALIDALESSPRDLYGGAVGWVAASGALDLGITLRSAFEHGGAVHVNAGAGIVADSDPNAEFEESANKMRTILARLLLLA